MSTLNRLSEGVRESLDVLAEGWHDVWNRARNAITRFTPSSEDEVTGTRWGLLSAELSENEDGVTVSIEAPGLDKDDFELSIHGQTLVVRGTKQSSRDRKEGHYHITERAYGRFERMFTLPVEVDEAATKATYKHGVLTVEMPKSKAARPKIISVS